MILTSWFADIRPIGYHEAMGFKSRTTKQNQTDEGGEVIAFPDGMDSFFSAFGGPSRDLSPLDQAQEYVYQAWEAPTMVRRLELAEAALAASPLCADAYNILADGAEDLGAAINLYRQGVKAGEQALGPQVFKDDVGYFWGLLETRPYMRARAGLAQCLWYAGEQDEAISHYREMLRLNPGDNQGIRYVLAACLANTLRDGALRELLADYEEDGMAAWSYTRALLAYRQQGDSAESQKLLREAKARNPHVVPYLIGQNQLPGQLPEFIGWGDESEAVSYVAEFYPGWQATPGALEWVALDAV